MEDVQVTARWANRVLRPLTSIYRRIEKHQETLSIIAAESRVREDADNTHGHAPDANAAARRTKDNCVGSDADEDDPVWVPGKKLESRRIRHKYSTRGEEKGKRRRNRVSIRSPGTPRTLPGAIEVATPLITGKIWEAPPSARLQRERSRRRKTNGQVQAYRDRYPLYKSHWQELLEQTGDPGFAHIARNLDLIFFNFLFKTSVSKHDVTQSPAANSSNRGASSLMSMVVRRLPEFIASEQDAQDEMNEDGDEDMADAYFTELESFYAPHGKGWKPLREAVRAQGIYLMGKMIQNKWLTGQLACALIERCRHSDTDACESLLCTFLSTHKPYPYPPALGQVGASDPHDDSPQLLHFYAYHNAVHHAFVFDELAKLLLRGILPPEWIATKLWTGWMARATISISRQDGICAAASQLIEAVLISASDIRPAGVAMPVMRYPVKQTTARTRTTRATSTASTTSPDLVLPCAISVQDALGNHVTSLLAALCGMHISRSRKEDDSADSTEGTNASHIISYLVFAVELEMDLRPLSHHTNITSHHILRRGCIWLANCLLQCNDAILSHIQCDIIPKPNIDTYLRVLASRADFVKSLASFVRQALRCLGSATDSESDHHQIRRMISRLPRMYEAPGASALLGRVAAEAAMEFAESTAEPDDHVWAVEIQEAVVAIQNNANDSMDKATEPKPQRGLYRWEEIIGEWVVRTPMAAKPKPMPVYCVQKRTFSTPTPPPCTPCSSDSSSPDSDCSGAFSSMTSSPSSVATKRTLEDTEDLPSERATKRLRYTPVVVSYNGKSEENEVSPISPEPRSTMTSMRGSIPSRRSIGLESLRARSTRRTAPPPEAAVPPRNVEVVIINHREIDESETIGLSVPQSTEEKRIDHRPLERRRQGRPQLATNSRTSGVLIRRPVSKVPCSDGEDSDDELSFL